MNEPRKGSRKRRKTMAKQNTYTGMIGDWQRLLATLEEEKNRRRGRQAAVRGEKPSPPETDRRLWRKTAVAEMNRFVWRKTVAGATPPEGIRAPRRRRSPTGAAGR
jgi:hypothetical protein